MRLRYGMAAGILAVATFVPVASWGAGPERQSGSVDRSEWRASTTLPRPAPEWQGTLDRTIDTSSEAYYQLDDKAPADAPNILLIMTDDVGFGASTTFGGPVPTATFDQLAQDGLRYNSFNTTALCAPTRAALLTGREPHAVGFGAITEMSTGFPGYNGILPRSAATIGQVFRFNGYATSWFGKNHNTPEWEKGPTGPFDRWPTGLGFDYFYGFMGGATSQYNPELYENTQPVERPAEDPDYILDRDLADHAISWLRTLHSAEPDKPFLLYYAPGTSHSPHHAPADWIARFKGRFDQGWDRMREETLARQIEMGVVPANTKLSPRPDSIPAWSSLSADQKRLYAHMMEVYAAALAHADYQIGRVIQEIREEGELDNTLIVYIQGDNGGSGEGGPEGSINDIAAINGFRADLATMLKAMPELGGPDYYNNYPVGWAWAMNTPFQWTKQVASHLGGVRNGMVISWPEGIDQPGSVRSQFGHVSDIAPTLYEAAGIPAPTRVNGIEQQKMDGISLLYSLNDANAEDKRVQQVFEMQGNAGIYDHGWLANTTPTRAPWDFAGPGGLPTDGTWQLYNLEEDFSQAIDLADKYPAKLKALTQEFWEQARKHDILPIDNRSFARWNTANRPSLLKDRTRFTFYPSSRRISGGAFPDLSGRSWQLDAQINAGPHDNGTVVMNGMRSAGWNLMLEDGIPAFTYKASDAPEDILRLNAKAPLADGDHRLGIRFVTEAQAGPGRVVLSIDGQEVASGQLPHVIPVLLSDNATIGWAFDTIGGKTNPPSPFTGTVDSVELQLLP
ncbi:arylsulfatase [Altericroceibacterium endophyticum]|uniref:Sulfatase-like hydrolase/transferase n=1 Tax=Altericroceibacterium endophyticum TaxID=1808508 RepID=A0A6I4T8X7_9SPHN|nr:arylsulfatase [Altericroceibacterium endophyticum]MXO66215.1 sulfatase-like hydrolase/transferase [Altericroceibacterium endophyticum]